MRSIFLATVLVGCAHGGTLPVEVEKQSTQGFDESTHVAATPGGFVAHVQILKYGGAPGPVRVTARTSDGNTVELHLRYRRGKKKCVSARAYRVTVRGLDPGDYELVVYREKTEIGGAHVSVANPDPAGGGRLVRRVAELGC